jgi:hypothetical protein
MSDEKKDAIIRNEPDTGAARDAYEDLRDWAIDEFQPRLKREIKAKLTEVARNRGVERKKVAMLLMRPPAGETRRSLIDFLYETLFD